jgi:hypothetical protein
MAYHHYFYLPIPEHFSSEEQLQLIKDLFDKDVHFNDSEVERGHYYLRINHSCVAIIENTTFGADLRNFIRIRVGGNQAIMINVLTVASQVMNGYFGDNSKEFHDSQGNVLWNAAKGETHILYTFGESMDRIEKSYPEIRKEYERGTNISNEWTASKMKEHLGITMKIEDDNLFFPIG